MTYDAWKLRSPDDDLYHNSAWDFVDEPEQPDEPDEDEQMTDKNIDWTPALVERLLALRAEGQAPTIIGAMLSAEFGVPITIGMVVGKLNRLRMNSAQPAPPADGRWTIGRLPRNACHYQTYPSMFCGRPSVGDQSYCPAHLQAIEAALGLSHNHPPEETTT